MNIHEALSPPKIDLRPVEHIRVWRDRQGAEYIRKAAAIVKTAFEVSDDGSNPTCLMYSALLKRPAPTTGNLKLAAIAMQSLGRTLRTMQALEKMATSPLFARVVSGLRSAAGAATTALPSAANTMMGLGAAAGALGGGAVWATNRAVGAEDQKLREKEIQRDTYRRLTAEVQAELERRGMAPTPSNTAAAVDYLT